MALLEAPTEYSYNIYIAVAVRICIREKYLSGRVDPLLHFWPLIHQPEKYVRNEYL